MQPNKRLVQTVEPFAPALFFSQYENSKSVIVGLINPWALSCSAQDKLFLEQDHWLSSATFAMYKHFFLFLLCINPKKTLKTLDLMFHIGLHPSAVIRKTLPFQLSGGKHQSSSCVLDFYYCCVGFSEANCHNFAVWWTCVLCMYFRVASIMSEVLSQSLSISI